VAFVVAAGGWAAAPAGALAAVSLHVTPATVHAGEPVRVHGSVGGGCGGSVTLLSAAFPHTHQFAGVPAVFAPVGSGGAFDVHVGIPAGRAPGHYTVGGRCGGGNLGITRALHVLAPRLRATVVRIASHPALVRVTVRFAGGLLRSGDAEAVNPNPFGGIARMAVVHPGIATAAPDAHRFGVLAQVRKGTGRLRIALKSAPGRFKYLSYRQRRHPERVVISLYRSRPRFPAAAIPRGVNGCLAITQQAGSPGSVTAKGTANGIFENQFTLNVRNAAGAVRGTTHVSFGTTAPNWQGTVGSSVAHPQTGTLEAVDFSARDGALSCIAQVATPLAPPLAPP
jgi:hypothetical protein